MQSGGHRRSRSDLGPSTSAAEPSSSSMYPPRRSDSTGIYSISLLPPTWEVPLADSNADTSRRGLPHVLAEPPPARTPGARPQQWDVPLFPDQRNAEPTPASSGGGGGAGGGTREAPPGIVGKVMEWLGYAGPDAKARRAFVSFVFSMAWWFSQFAAVIVLLAYSASHKSPTMPGLTEWQACDRPLGTWNALWLVKVVLSALLSVWNWKRQREAIGIRRRPRGSENGQASNNADPERAARYIGNGQPATIDANGRLPPTRTANAATGENTPPANTPQSRLYGRISFCTSFLSLAWFLTAHVLEYTSLNTCRFAAPHLWWLTFGILCTLYLMILEIFLLGLLVFILGPVLYLVYNILLLCLGRHPLQNPHAIKPDVDKIPKVLVDRIPLVLYIPPPPDELADASGPAPNPTVPAAAMTKDHGEVRAKSPAPSTSGASATSKRRFAFLRRKRGGGRTGAGASAGASGSQGGGGGKDGAREKRTAGGEDGGADDVDADADLDADADVPWDETWEKGAYPFVRLEGNRAVCAICLMDFEAPRRVRGAAAAAAAALAHAHGPADGARASADGERVGGSGGGGSGGSGETGPSLPGETKAASEKRDGGAEETDGPAEMIRVGEGVTEEERDALELADAGEGAQPLRLLTCGHVFHKTCLDPWLTDVSGRCPICQRPVEIPEPSKKGKRRRQGT